MDWIKWFKQRKSEAEAEAEPLPEFHVYHICPPENTSPEKMTAFLVYWFQEMKRASTKNHRIVTLQSLVYLYDEEYENSLFKDFFQRYP